MRRLLLLLLVMAIAVAVGGGAAHAQTYVGGTPPQAGPVAPTFHTAGNSHFVPVNTDTPQNQGVQVLGITFTRTANGLATTGADIAELVGIAIAAVALGTVLVRRSRASSSSSTA